MNVAEIDPAATRESELAGLHPQFLRRWSPRAMTGEPISEQELLTLFEAARWAPSSYNAQPWRFVYAHRDTDYWPRLFNLMVEANQAWTRNAAVLVLVTSRNRFEHNDKPAPTHRFDAGSAWMSVALQASHMGLVAHGMQGFDYEKAQSEFGIPDQYSVDAMFAIGRPGDIEGLPEQAREREKPSSRRPLGEIISEGEFTFR